MQLLDDPNPDTHIQPVFVLKNDGGALGQGKNIREVPGGEAGGDMSKRSGRKEAALLSDSWDWDSILE
jgi:hypothetical protein